MQRARNKKHEVKSKFQSTTTDDDDRGDFTQDDRQCTDSLYTPQRTSNTATATTTPMTGSNDSTNVTPASFAATRQGSGTKNTVVLLVNGRSGSKHAQKLIKTGWQVIGWRDTNITCYMYDLTDTDERRYIIGRLPSLRKESRQLIVAACGGDGTCKWVIEELNRAGTDAASRTIMNEGIPLAIVPFGSGNDLSRALRWGAAAPANLVNAHGHILGQLCKRFVTQSSQSNILMLDMWKCQIRVHPKGQILAPKAGGQEVVMQSQTLNRELTVTMCNYFSIGTDAEVTYKFEKSRANSKFMNKFQYLSEGLKVNLSGSGQCSKQIKAIDANLDPAELQRYIDEGSALGPQQQCQQFEGILWEGSDDQRSKKRCHFVLEQQVLKCYAISAGQVEARSRNEYMILHKTKVTEFTQTGNQRVEDAAGGDDTSHMLLLKLAGRHAKNHPSAPDAYSLVLEAMNKREANKWYAQLRAAVDCAKSVANNENIPDSPAAFGSQHLLGELGNPSSIVFSNIPSYGAGLNIWKMAGSNASRGSANFQPQMMNDGLVEMLLMATVNTVAALKLGSTSGVSRHAQARNFVIRFNSDVKKIYCQIDGEGYKIRCPKDIIVSHAGQRAVIIGDDDSHYVY